ncbi:MAG: hypothetical protein GY866_13970 [Proteobacteria bacterium]|nr:hypothetical protein [Pseudomonadota bacterium]
MLTKGDDYPIHQTPLPIAYSGTDRNFYDRYFFNGYPGDGEYYFATALGVYPNINIMDASFSVIHDGVQHSIHASRILNMERMETKVGPIEVEIIEPLQKLAIRVGKNEHGITADLVFEGRVEVIEEPRFIFQQGPRTLFDYTRLTQSGTWSGWIEVQGHRIEVSKDRYYGTRDRSWGIRPVGIQDPQPIVPERQPQFYFLWAPLNFDDCVSFYAENAHADGSPWARSASFVPVGKEGSLETSKAGASLAFKSGTRHAKSAVLDFQFDNGNDMQITLDPQYNFYQSGLGYLNPEWGHGHFKGDNVVGYEAFDLATVNETEFMFWHVQAFCKARLTGGKVGEKTGSGILEQLIVGPHEPSGFTDFFDMAP